MSREEREEWLTVRKMCVALPWDDRRVREREDEEYVGWLEDEGCAERLDDEGCEVVERMLQEVNSYVEAQKVRELKTTGEGE